MNNKNKMNKLIVLCIPNLNVMGGTEMQTLMLARYLVSNGYQTTICCYFLYENKIIELFKRNNIDVECLKLSPNNLFKIFLSLYSFFKQRKQDFVHIQYVAPGLIPIIAAKIAGVKNLFATVHQPYNGNFKAKLFLRLGAMLCSAFICVSRETEKSWFGKDELYDNLKVKQKHFTIHNGIDISEIDSAIAYADSDHVFQKYNALLKNKKVIGVVARLRSEKGHALLLASMVIVVKAIPDAVLLVIGDGPDKSILEDMAKTLGMNDNIFWLGPLESTVVYRFYKIMHVIAIPSVFEGFGLSAIEAMAAGRPVVASKVGGLKEVIEDGLTGYLVEPKKEILAEKLIELLKNTNAANNMGTAGRHRAEQLFSMQKFGKSMTSVYERYSVL